ncbi:hypothetical protein [Galbibacter sp. BG1]
MATTIISQPNGILPAFNNSIVKWENTTLSNVKYSEVYMISGSLPFIIYPAPDGTFTINMKDAIKVVLGDEPFKDYLLPNLSLGDWVYEDDNLKTVFNTEFRVCDDNGTCQGKSLGFRLIKSAEDMIGYRMKLDASPDMYLMLPSENNVDFKATYFEGYPFEVAMINMEGTNKTLKIKNVTTGMEASKTTNNLNVKRIVVSDGAYDLTTEDILPLTPQQNRLEIYVNDVFKNNLILDRVDAKCGVYLKWFNRNGAYSYWLFDKFFDDSITVKTDKNRYYVGYDNLENLTKKYQTGNKTATRSYTLTTTVKKEDYKTIESLYMSPSVEMYVHQTPFNQLSDKSFISVDVDDKTYLVSEQKNGKIQVKVTITLPEYDMQNY